MNIQPFQTQPSTVTPRTVGSRLDIRSETPALSHNASPSPAPARSASPVGKLNGTLSEILNPQEQQALADAFGQSDAPVYSGRGKGVEKPPVLGSQLDLQA